MTLLLRMSLLGGVPDGPMWETQRDVDVTISIREYDKPK